MSENERYNGTVIFFKKIGFGFLEWFKNGIRQDDIFVHYSDLDMDGFKILRPGQKVSFALGLNHKSQLKAVNVILMSE